MYSHLLAVPPTPRTRRLEDALCLKNNCSIMLSISFNVPGSYYTIRQMCFVFVFLTIGLWWGWAGCPLFLLVLPFERG